MTTKRVLVTALGAAMLPGVFVPSALADEKSMGMRDPANQVLAQARRC